ncbi:ketosteroid isomerase-like protein [Luteibacter sp. Sphag1AF]|uniref:nuclear transport factor 2 family protein n=1 Tax=Luteibacter sp. Sphag1AF TaxID=2587031 RepID=UPI00161DBBDA|nr:nuclear transport factor 2 family protein [Luteibacter sp. Sphag1AF]MBB3228546.1 ketosteroid isomerase-like protein [Luteibacter sp. Sphag1AF]
MRVKRFTPGVLVVAALAMGIGSSAMAQSRAATPEAAAKAYFAAEAAFDVPALERVLAPGFVEISPRGEVDERAAVISFYAPDKKVAYPPIEFGAFNTRMSGNIAFLTTSMALTAGGRERHMTVGLTVQKGIGGWVLVSAQYTPIPPPPAPPAPLAPPAPPAPVKR